MRVIVNGEPVETTGGSVASLLPHLGIAADRPGIAVALNAEVVPRRRWAETTLRDGDVIEIIRAMQGG